MIVSYYEYNLLVFCYRIGLFTCDFRHRFESDTSCSYCLSRFTSHSCFCCACWAASCTELTSFSCCSIVRGAASFAVEISDCYSACRSLHPSVSQNSSLGCCSYWQGVGRHPKVNRPCCPYYFHFSRRFAGFECC